MKKFLKLIAPVLLVAPSVAHAQELVWFDTLVGSIQDIVNALVPLLVGVALVAFLYGLVKYIFAAGNEESQADGRRIMIAGIVGLFAAVAVWGIIEVLSGAFGINTGGSVTPPQPPSN
ncbi:MAG: hypothetical protein U5L75_00270 [Candidatus Campbellbacteria bacterium]|nr:hypothetical protein [Candidatus Campbellbacteria bacterium]